MDADSYRDQLLGTNAGDTKPLLVRSVIALCICTIGSMAFGEIESNWFVSYYNNIPRMER